ncbi:hypothetical protein LCGC14_2146780, partial [marine sediment metagenome]
MKKVLAITFLVAILFISGCGGTTTTEISEPSKPVSSMTNEELRQEVDYNQGKMETTNLIPRAMIHG